MYATEKKGTHNGFCRGLSVLSSIAVLSSSVVPAMPVLGAEKPVGSRVVYSGEGYERDLALEVGGEPFFYNGVQIRIDKEADVYGFNDDQIKQLMQMAKMMDLQWRICRSGGPIFSRTKS